jgi:hypothetical protein
VTRSSAGAYGFSHRGFLEYFLACRLIRGARAGVDALRDALVTARLTPGCTARFAELAIDDRDVAAAVRAVGAGRYTAEASENAIRLAAALEPQGAAG